MLQLSGLCAAAVMLFAASASAQAIRQNPGFSTSDLGRTDDGSSWLVPIGFEVTYFGANYTAVYVNNNGYVAFDEAVTTLFSATTIDHRLLAVFFADVDTRVDGGGGTMHFGADTVDGKPAFAATWPGVGYYERHDDKLDSFQVVLIDRSDTGAGHFDVEYNYGSIAWESGDRSDGSVDGVGGSPAAIVGYSDGVDATFFPGSGSPGSFLDSNPVTGLIHGQSQSGVTGRYTFAFRQDAIAGATAPSEAGAVDAAADAAVPEPPRAAGCTCDLTVAHANVGWAKAALLTCGALALLLRRRRHA